MRKAKTGQLIISTLLFLCMVWLATPRVYVHKLFDHRHETHQSQNETTVQAESESDCDFDKYDTPVYFTIFKFINKFIPLKPKEEALIIKHTPPRDVDSVPAGPSRASPLV